MVKFKSISYPAMLRVTAVIVQCMFVQGVLAATTSTELEELQKKYELEKQRNTLQADLLANQKALIDAQKAAVESQTALLTSQKAQLEALFPQITGGKTGAVTFDTGTNIGPLAQPGAVEALSTLAKKICVSISEQLNPRRAEPPAQPAGKSTEKSANQLTSTIVIATDSDLKLVAQARWINLQLAGIVEGYKSVSVPPPPAGTQSPSALPPGLALFEVGAALKEIASFTQLFRTDTTIFSATIKIDQDTVNEALTECLIPKAGTVYNPKSLLIASLSFPTSSDIQENFKVLAALRGKADAELNLLSGKEDAASKRRAGRITALNAAMDALISGLFATSEKSPEPLFVGALAGEAMQRKITDGAMVLKTSLTNAAASGIKRTSIWRSDRLYAWATVTINYTLIDQTGKVFAAGAAQNSPEPLKIVVEP